MTDKEVTRIFYDHKGSRSAGTMPGHVGGGEICLCWTWVNRLKYMTPACDLDKALGLEPNKDI